MRRVQRSLVLAATAVLVLLPQRAHAFENEWHAGLRGGFASLKGRGSGPAAGIHGAYGVSDMFDVTFEGFGSCHGGCSDPGVVSGSAGLLYKVDVLEWIPYVGLLGGYYHFFGTGRNGESGSEIGGSVQLGLDYLLTRNLGLAAEIRWHGIVHDGLHPDLFSATLGAEYRWGF